MRPIACLTAWVCYGGCMRCTTRIRILDVTTTLRHHPIEALWVSALISPAALVIGIRPAEVAAYALLEWFVNLADANLPLPMRVDALLRHFIVTPGFHRCHHSRDPAETDTNYGQTFTVWDMLFSSQCRSLAYRRQSEFGLDDFRDMKSQGLYQLLTQPLLKPVSSRAWGPQPVGQCDGILTVGGYEVNCADIP